MSVRRENLASQQPIPTNQTYGQTDMVWASCLLFVNPVTPSPRLLDIQFPLLILYSYSLLHTGHPNKKATYWSTYLNRFTWENDIRCQGLGRKDFQECKEFSQIDLMHRSCNVRKILQGVPKKVGVTATTTSSNSHFFWDTLYERANFKSGDSPQD